MSDITSPNYEAQLGQRLAKAIETLTDDRRPAPVVEFPVGDLVVEVRVRHPVADEG